MQLICLRGPIADGPSPYVKPQGARNPGSFPYQSQREKKFFFFPLSFRERKLAALSVLYINEKKESIPLHPCLWDVISTHFERLHWL